MESIENGGSADLNGEGLSSQNPELPARRMVDLLVTPEEGVWEMRCGHCGKIERYASEKEALDAAQEHCRSFGLNEEPRLRLDAANDEGRDLSE